MAVIVPLDSGQASITRLLLTEKAPATVEAIASELKVTSRGGSLQPPVDQTFLMASLGDASPDLVRRRLRGG